MATLDEIKAKVLCDTTMFYVYVLRRPGGSPFYVGKGRGDRICKHEWTAAKPEQRGYRLAVIRKLSKAGQTVNYDLVGLYRDEAETFAEERRLIALYGRADQKKGPLANKTDGGEGAANPSAKTLAKRAAKLRRAMRDPAKRAAAAACLALSKEKRAMRHAEATRRPEFAAAVSERMKRCWQDEAFRERTTAASKRAQDLVWKAQQAAGVARVQADATFHERRNAGVRSEATRAKRNETNANPEIRQARRDRARRQRQEADATRLAVMDLARELGASIKWPIHTSSLGTWRSIEQRLLAGERVFDADPSNTAERWRARFWDSDMREKLSVAGQKGAASRWEGAR